MRMRRSDRGAFSHYCFLEFGSELHVLCGELSDDAFAVSEVNIRTRRALGDLHQHYDLIVGNKHKIIRILRYTIAYGNTPPYPALHREPRPASEVRGVHASDSAPRLLVSGVGTLGGVGDG